MRRVSFRAMGNVQCLYAYFSPCVFLPVSVSLWSDNHPLQTHTRTPKRIISGERTETVTGSDMSAGKAKSGQQGNEDSGIDSSQHQPTLPRDSGNDLQQLRGCHSFAGPLDNQPETSTAMRGSVMHDTSSENESTGVVGESFSDKPCEFVVVDMQSAGLEGTGYTEGQCYGTAAPSGSASGRNSIGMRDQHETDGNGKSEVDRLRGGPTRSLADRLDALPEFTPFGGMPIIEQEALAPAAVGHVDFATIALGAQFDADFMIPGPSRATRAGTTRTDAASNTCLGSTRPVMREACEPYAKQHKKSNNSGPRKKNGASRSCAPLRVSRGEVSKGRGGEGGGVQNCRSEYRSTWIRGAPICARWLWTKCEQSLVGRRLTRSNME